MSQNILLELGPDAARDFLNAFGAAVYLVDVEDKDFRYVAHNVLAEGYTGLCHDAVTGRTMLDVYGPDVAGAFLPHWEKCVEQGSVYQYEGHWTPPRTSRNSWRPGSSSMRP